MAKKQNNLLTISFVALGLFILILIVAQLGGLTGFAVGDQPKELKNLVGRWTVNETIDAHSCGLPKNANLLYYAKITEEGSILSVEIPENAVSFGGAQGNRKAFVMKGPVVGDNFMIDYKDVIFGVQGGDAKITSIETTLGSDCNTFTANVKWDWSDGSDSCAGTAVLTGVSEDQKGCFAPECKESWICPDWSVCANGTQTRTCSDVNKCNTSSAKPAETQSCAMPLPTPSKSYTWIIFVVLALMALSVGGYSFTVVEKKKKFSGQLDELTQSIRKSLVGGDLNGAFNGYKVLTEQFSMNQSKLTKKDAGRIYKESLDIYAEMVKLQAQKA